MHAREVDKIGAAVAFDFTSAFSSLAHLLLFMILADFSGLSPAVGRAINALYRDLRVYSCSA